MLVKKDIKISKSLLGQYGLWEHDAVEKRARRLWEAPCTTVTAVWSHHDVCQTEVLGRHQAVAGEADSVDVVAPRLSSTRISHTCCATEKCQGNWQVH